MSAHRSCLALLCILAACTAPAEPEGAPSSAVLRTAAHLLSGGSWAAPTPDLRLRHARIEGRLQDLADACLADGAEVCARLAADMEVRQEGGSLLVQVDLAAGLRAEHLSTTALAAAGARVDTLGHDVADLWVPPGALITLAETDPAIAFVRLPQRPHAMVGAALSQGVGLTGADSYHCTGNKGAGVDIAVVDSGFSGLNQAVASGDIPGNVTLMPGPQEKGQTHGTVCLEVVADMAPDATLYAVPTPTMSRLQKFAYKQLPGMGLEVFSHSVGWYGQGFGDNSGKICRLAEHVRAAGVSLLASAGNGGHKRFWRGEFKDADGNGWHEFDDGEIHNSMVLLPGQKYRAILDWDEYPKGKTDLDLYFCRIVAGKCQQIAKSNTTQNGKQSPMEGVNGKVKDSGFYSLAIHRKGGTGNPKMRLYLLDGVALKYHQKAGSVGEPASCTAATAIGAAPWDDWGDEVLAGYSAHGPTEDGRIKPDIVGPSSVKTAIMGSFGGTSASCPHVAGAVALVMAATPVTAHQATERLLADATPAGPSGPDNGWGHGALALDGPLSGATCHPGDNVACPTPCGSTGTVVCAPGCLAGTCTAPKETCNGVDDDCDGEPDEDFACVRNTTKPCTAKCGAPGEHTCLGHCKWGPCHPASDDDPCDGIDNDCDGQTDEDADCQPGAAVPCTTACDSPGARVCGAACSLGVCEPGSEICNGKDDDCDGDTDETFTCAAGGEGSCKTSCGSTGTRTCAVDCSWYKCKPPVEVCNERDDDCDGSVDEGLDCGGCSASPAGPSGGGGGPTWLLLGLLAALSVARYRRRLGGVA